MANVKKEKDMVKSRLVVLARMFYSLTDEEHQMTNTEILEYLKEHDAPANEKTLRGDIRLLKELGVDIVTIVSRPNRYYQGKREFSVPELKLLIDAVSSSRFITTKKSRDLGAKLSSLASDNQKKELRRNVYATNRVKNSNESIYGMVDTINEAINSHRRIQFRYREYTGELKPVLRNDGEVYELSPYALFWNEDYYYVVGWSEKHGNVSSFRADRLVDPVITEKRAVRKPEDFDLDDYSRRIFEMFDGEPTEVKLEVKDDFAKYIVDRFGTGIETEPSSDGYFRVTVEVSLSPTFYAWVFRFGGEIRILSPAKAVDEITEMAKKLAERETI
ncbi:MAG: WYL domain-containing protein [Eubacterium sp.]|nr:WYL domain-containing protein [Eubacterium sp.]